MIKNRSFINVFVFALMSFVLPTYRVLAQQPPTPIQIESLTNPSKHAWDLFLGLSHPATDPKQGRGLPDFNKKIGEPGQTVWESWRQAKDEVFRSDGKDPGEWDAKTPEIFKSFDLPKPVLIKALSLGLSINKAADDLTAQDFLRLTAVDPNDAGVFDPANLTGGGETRMNKSTFEFIRANQLYNVEGQEQLYLDVTSGKKPPLDFPVDSIEVKAMWKLFTQKEIDDKKPAHFHTSTDKEGKLYGLLALHIITKDVPNWFWCSFRQKEERTPLVPSVDSFHRPSQLTGTKWEFYELSGTQTDFVDSMGRATLLSDPHVENGFERSSCITCHSYAGIGAPSKAPRGDRPDIFFTQSTNPEIPQRDADSPFAQIGIPDSSIFVGKRIPTKEGDAQNVRRAQRYIQLDFLFSLHIRAKRIQP